MIYSPMYESSTDRNPKKIKELKQQAKHKATCERNRLNRKKKRK